MEWVLIFVMVTTNVDENVAQAALQARFSSKDACEVELNAWSQVIDMKNVLTRCVRVSTQHREG